MPRIIENLPQRLMEEARRQVQQSGYASLTIRSVAKRCGVGVGTVYNYYPSKDALVASFMLSDWKAIMEDIQRCADEAAEPTPVLQAIYDNLQQFLRLHQAVFQDSAAASGFSGSFSRYHGVLRSQLAGPLRRFCRDDFTAEFIAESLLVWTVADTPFETIHPLLIKLF